MTRAAVLVVAFMLTACAGDDGGTASPTTEPSTTTSLATTSALSSSRDPVTLEVTLADYEIHPATTSLAAGAYQLAVTNTDRAPHDVVLLQTDLGLDALPTQGIRIDELDDRLDLRARTTTIAGGAAGSLTATLRPGTYLLVCTVPHHYVRDDMAVALTVT